MEITTDTSTPNPQSPVITPERVEDCLEVLQALVADRKLLASLPHERRVELLMAAGKVSRPSRLEIMKLAKVHRRNRKKAERNQDRAARATTGIRAARESAVYVAPAQLTSGEAPDDAGELLTPRHCYVCKVEYRRLHFFYDSMCPACGDFNYQKRFQTASMDGQVAVITGARLKIGYQAALLMLRAGARVIVTTRFPHDAAIRYARETDFGVWGHRLQIHGLDLRHSPSVEVFCRFLNHSLDRLDVLINNAAQTVRRPAGFYQHLLATEALSVHELPEAARAILRDHEECKQILASGGAKALPSKGEGKVDGTGLAAWHGGSTGIGIRSSAALSQVRYTYDDDTSGREVFPEGKLDVDLQQVDLRAMNSWRMALADVPTPEMIEVQLVNAVAPFILCAKLKPLMLKDRTGQKHIVNVSAMEGKFTRFTKTDKHPHTNMAKASLNMMTLTSAPDYAKDGIYMNAVDTGWVTDEDPAHLSKRKIAEHDFQPPLDIVDGAARVIDPIFHGLNTGEHVYGKFLKDYFPTSW